MLVTVSVLVLNLNGEEDTAAAAATRGEVRERSAEVVEEFAVLRPPPHLWLPTAPAAAAAAAAAVRTGTTSTLPPRVTAPPVAEAAEEFDVPLPVSAPSSSASLLSESEESPVNGTDLICPARFKEDNKQLRNEKLTEFLLL